MSSKFSMILVLLFMFSVTAVYAQSPASISVHKQVKPVFKGEVHNPVLKFEVMTSQNDVEAGQFDLQIGESTAHLIRSEEHTSELQSRGHLVCRLLLEKKKKKQTERRYKRIQNRD